MWDVPGARPRKQIKRNNTMDTQTRSAEARSTLATGSASEIIIAELTGKPIRKLNRERLLKTGDMLSNRFGQQLWTVEAFHPKCVRVSEWPIGSIRDYTWEQVYTFYERVPEAVASLNIADEGRR